MRDKFVRAVFPVSFDPITNGHLDVINRGRRCLTFLMISSSSKSCAK